jgi:hypothetical protein
VQPSVDWDFVHRLTERQIMHGERSGDYLLTFPDFYEPEVAPVHGTSRKLEPGDVVDYGGSTLVLGPPGQYSLEHRSGWFFGRGEQRRGLSLRLGVSTLQRLDEVSDLSPDATAGAHWLYVPLAGPPHRVMIELDKGEGIEHWSPALLARFEALDPKRYCLTIDAGMVDPVEAPLPQALECLVIAGGAAQLGAPVHRSIVELLLEPLRNLRYLSVRGAARLDPAGIANNSALEFLEINRDSVTMVNTVALARLRNLRALRLTDHSDFGGLTSLEFLANLRELRYLDVTGDEAKSLKPIGAMPHLIEVRADESDIELLPRQRMPALRVLRARSNSLPAREVERFAALNPAVQIWYRWGESLTKMMKEVTRIRTGDIEIDDPEEIRQFSLLLEVAEDSYGRDCWGGFPWLELFRGEDRIATLALESQRFGLAIRWREQWSSGVYLRDDAGRRMVDWLERHWVPEPKRERKRIDDILSSP